MTSLDGPQPILSIPFYRSLCEVDVNHNLLPPVKYSETRLIIGPAALESLTLSEASLIPAYLWRSSNQIMTSFTAHLAQSFPGLVALPHPCGSCRVRKRLVTRAIAGDGARVDRSSKSDVM